MWVDEKAGWTRGGKSRRFEPKEWTRVEPEANPLTKIDCRGTPKAVGVRCRHADYDLP